MTAPEWSPFRYEEDAEEKQAMAILAFRARRGRVRIGLQAGHTYVSADGRWRVVPILPKHPDERTIYRLTGPDVDTSAGTLPILDGLLWDCGLQLGNLVREEDWS